MDWATFNFAADAYENIKDYYKELYKQHFDDLGKTDDNQYGLIIKAKLQEAIGDISIWNKKYDEAMMYYGNADLALHRIFNSIKKHINYSNFQSLITIQLKQGFLEEIRNNYSTAQNFYLQLEKLTYNYIDIYKHNPETNSPLDLNEYHVLRHCFLARIYLNLKNINCPILTDKLINKNTSKLLFSDTGFLMYKLGIANFYGGNYPIAIIQLCKTRLTSIDSYIKTLCSIKISQIITIYICRKICQNDLLAPLFSENSGSPHKNKTIEDIVNELTNNKIINNFDESNYHEDSKNNIEEIIKSYYIDDIILILQNCGKELQSLGLHTQASHVYFSIFSICGILLESIPWVNLEKTEQKPHKFVTQIRQIKSFFDRTMEMAYDANLSSYHGAFTQFCSSFYREYIRSDEDIPSRSNEYETPLDAIKYDPPNDRQLIIWQYSPLGESMLSMKYWIKRALDWMEANNNQQSISTLNTIPQGYVLPQGVWPYAMSLWVSGRNDAKLIIYDLKQNSINLSIDSDDSNRIKNQTQSAIKNLALSFTYLKMIADNDRHIILPPLSQITYNIWEVLVAIVRTYQKTEQSYDNSILKTQQFLEPDDTSSFSTSFLSLKYVYELTRHYLQEIILLVKPNSSVRRDLIKNKYYIHNDFEDPTFGMYWTFYHAFTKGAELHYNVMEEIMNELMNTSPSSNKPNIRNKSKQSNKPLIINTI